MKFILTFLLLFACSPIHAAGSTAALQQICLAEGPSNLSGTCASYIAGAVDAFTLQGVAGSGNNDFNKCWSKIDKMDGQVVRFTIRRQIETQQDYLDRLSILNIFVVANKAFCSEIYSKQNVAPANIRP